MTERQVIHSAYLGQCPHENTCPSLHRHRLERGRRDDNMPAKPARRAGARSISAICACGWSSIRRAISPITGATAGMCSMCWRVNSTPSCATGARSSSSGDLSVQTAQRRSSEQAPSLSFDAPFQHRYEKPVRAGAARRHQPALGGLAARRLRNPPPCPTARSPSRSAAPPQIPDGAPRKLRICSPFSCGSTEQVM